MPVQPTTIAVEHPSESTATHTAESLEDMTVSEIKALADSLGYDVTATKKADIINEFLDKQNGSI